MTPIDAGRPIDWNKTSNDYALHRPGPPERFYRTLHAWGIGTPGQRILDLGTGTGIVARAFAAQGACVSAIDIAGGQIEAARELAAAQGLEIDFRVAPAESIPFGAQAFDVAIANQCWMYFDADAVAAQLRRVLLPTGVFVTSNFNWLATDPIARATEALVLQHNPDWTGAGWDGTVPQMPRSCEGRFDLLGAFWFDADIAFTRESWRGRIRACRGTGATLDAAALERFDAEHAALLASIAPSRFTVRHRIDAHVLRPRSAAPAPKRHGE
ncbi:MAG TPA: class I SAM-dependent methyltransferase [Burkholderiaceae bacterium]|nr:class I SAM-dependent methyltransferase [Burkholderiaceae bacterium]